jgi:hypothetical protein
MRKLSVTEYLIAQNQQQSVTCFYPSFLSAVSILVQGKKYPNGSTVDTFTIGIETHDDFTEEHVGLQLINMFAINVEVMHVIGWVLEWHDASKKAKYTIFLG